MKRLYIIFVICSLVFGFSALAIGCGSSGGGATDVTTTTVAETTTTTAGSATTTTTTASTTTTVSGSSIAIQGQATAATVTGAGVNAFAALTGWASADVTVGYYDDDGNFNGLGTTSTDANGKYSLSLTVPDEIQKNLTVRVSKEGTSYRSTIPSISSEGTNTAPICGPDSEIRSKVFVDLLATQNVSRDAIDMGIVEQKTPKVDTATDANDIQDLAQAFKNTFSSEEQMLNDLGYGGSLEAIKNKRTELERQYFNQMREAAYNGGSPTSVLNKKTTQGSLETAMLEYIKDEIGMDPSVYSSYTGGLDRMLAADVGSSNQMYITVYVNTIIDRRSRGMQNKITQGQVLATYLNTNIPTDILASAEAIITTLRSNANQSYASASEARFACSEQLANFFASDFYAYVNGNIAQNDSNGSFEGQSITVQEPQFSQPTVNWNSLAVQFCTGEGLSTTEAYELANTVGNDLWGNFNFNETNPTVWAQNINNIQTAALASVEATIGTVVTRNGVTGEQVKQALAYIWGPSE